MDAQSPNFCKRNGLLSQKAARLCLPERPAVWRHMRRTFLMLLMGCLELCSSGRRAEDQLDHPEAHGALVIQSDPLLIGVLLIFLIVRHLQALDQLQAWQWSTMQKGAAAELALAAADLRLHMWDLCTCQARAHIVLPGRFLVAGVRVHIFRVPGRSWLQILCWDEDVVEEAQAEMNAVPESR